jgi:hypothetical protein
MKEAMSGFLEILAIVGGWFILMRWILPRLGVPT